MTLNFSAYPNADDATKARTEEFFKLSQDKNTTDAELLKLVYEGIYFEARDYGNNTALLNATIYSHTNIYGYPDTVHALLTAGANVEAHNAVDYTPLLCAAWTGNTKIMKLLLAAGTNLEARNDNGYTPLLSAAFNGKTDAVHMLLSAGVNIEARDNEGCTALIRASFNSHPDTTQVLLAAGANIKARNNNNHTALNRAGNRKVRDVLNSVSRFETYDDFVANGIPPQSAADVYKLLAVTPLVDSKAPVDYVGNIRKIFAHAQWADKEQAAEVLSQMQDNGRINAATIDSILDATFPELLHTMRLQPRVQGRTL